MKKTRTRCSSVDLHHSHFFIRSFMVCLLSLKLYIYSPFASLYCVQSDKIILSRFFQGYWVLQFVPLVWMDHFVAVLVSFFCTLSLKLPVVAFMDALLNVFEMRLCVCLCTCVFVALDPQDLSARSTELGIRRRRRT